MATIENGKRHRQMIRFDLHDYFIEFHDLGYSTTVVCLSNWDVKYTIERSDVADRRMGQSMFGKIKANLAYVIPKANCWYKNLNALNIEEFSTAISKQRIIAYGISMGAYGAFKLSSLMKIDFIVAISPQFMVNETFMREIKDGRWKEDLKCISYERSDEIKNYLINQDGMVIYDNKHPLDRFHAEKINQSTNVSLIALPYSGHPSSFIINKAYGLTKLINEVVERNANISKIKYQLIKSHNATLLYRVGCSNDWHSALALLLDNKKNVNADVLSICSSKFSLDIQNDKDTFKGLLLTALSNNEKRAGLLKFLFKKYFPDSLDSETVTYFV